MAQADCKRREEWREVTVYLASRNSSGVHRTTLRVNADDRLLGFLNSEFLPWGYLVSVTRGDDWRVAHRFFTYEEAKADYVALEKARVKKAQEAIRQMAA